ncbi:AurF N-oxygenase family protein [Segniliparus rugosus]|uniref:p-aminobenzoate N-oxygenase AurF n=1 Tax=Segniliparus rugosus (strain ATCC BAA-974 / DSM 45345 / CCUG 50838 / CIP 108380 / JCM 13579 / CDC 945) TaxID=679197 RepID=E5XUY6_SEGRC|nr:diiron oxygenase [Segniliparus rugosus]EFV11822.1 hypothetical protein HMPREF9336_03308 [Segniliparus rugosus ATCC BAA-974]
MSNGSQELSATIPRGAAGLEKRAVVNPELAAERRLQASADRYYDPEIDVDWDMPAQEGKWWGSRKFSFFTGTKLWERLTPEQRHEVIRHESGSLMITGILFEAALGVALYRDLMHTKIVDNRARYLLTEIGEEARHSTMFARIVEKMNEGAVRPVRSFLPKALLTIVPSGASLIVPGPMLYAAALMSEETFDQVQRSLVGDPDVQPHIRFAMRIHVIEESRHMAFAKEEIARGMRESGPLTRFLTRMTIANSTLVLPVLGVLNTGMYRAAGIHPVRGVMGLFFGKRYGEVVKSLYGPIARYCYSTGLIEGSLVRLVWRLSRALPDDVKAQMRDEKRVRAAA